MGATAALQFRSGSRRQRDRTACRSCFCWRRGRRPPL